MNILTAMVLANRDRAPAVVREDREERRNLELLQRQRELDGVPGIGSGAVADQAAKMHRERASKYRD